LHIQGRLSSRIFSLHSMYAERAAPYTGVLTFIPPSTLHPESCECKLLLYPSSRCVTPPVSVAFFDFFFPLAAFYARGIFFYLICPGRSLLFPKPLAVAFTNGRALSMQAAFAIFLERDLPSSLFRYVPFPIPNFFSYLYRMRFNTACSPSGFPPPLCCLWLSCDLLQAPFFQ